MLIGQVPQYDVDIPAYLAKHSYLTWLDDVLHYQRPVPAPQISSFIDVLGGGPETIVRPTDVLCQSRCLIERNGISLYKDSSHLSSHGSMLMADALNTALNASPRETAPSQLAAKSLNQKSRSN